MRRISPARATWPWALGCALLLAGCTGAARQARNTIPAATALSTPTPAIAAATPTASLIPPTPTESATASSTIAPSLTPTARPSATPTSTLRPALPTAPPTATQTPTFARTPYEVIVDNRDPRFASSGHWFSGDGGHNYGRDCAWAPRGIQNIAYITPRLERPGAYEIYAWWCGDPNHDQTERAPIQIHPTQGHVPFYAVYVNLQRDAGQWNSLGTYYLERDGFLILGGTLDGNIVADAFRFVYRGPERLLIMPTPLPTPQLWTTHPPSPLEQLTSGDLSARLGLTNRFFSDAPIVTREETTFDDCQAFPREGCAGMRAGWRVQVRYQDLLVTYRVAQDYRLVAIESPENLAARQVRYLQATRGEQYLFVQRYPDDTWQLFGADYNQSYATHMPLSAEAAQPLCALAREYGTLVYQSPDGLRLQLYGLGRRVELAEADRPRLAALGTELAVLAWPKP